MDVEKGKLRHEIPITTSTQSPTERYRVFRKLSFMAMSMMLIVMGTTLVWRSECLERYFNISGPNLSKMVLDKGFHGHMVEGTQGAVAVEAQECSDVGVDILKQGGNAVDAAIASALCIGVINSFATGIGGGGFMLIRAPNGTFEFIDFRETAPAASHKDMFVDDPSLAKYGGMSVGVPGEIRGFELAHQRHGKLPWETLFQPAIRMAREGFRTTRYLNEKLQSSLPWIEDEWEWAEIFAPKGSIAEIDDIIKRPNLAQTLETIAKQGADAFYEGPIAQAIVNATRQAGGILTEDDMRNYKALIREPVSTFYHGRKVITGPAPTSGPVLLSMLNVIERYNLASKGPTPVNLHRIIETMKFGAAFRTELGDPQWTHNQDRLDEIISKDWAARVRTNLTDDTTHDPLYYQPKYDHLESPGTMHLSVVDRDDGAVALTSTVNLLFGSRVMDPVTGVVLNDEMDDFSIPSVPNAFGLYPSYHNYAAPGKRPLSSTTPTIIELDNRFEMALGGSGGSQIVTASLDVILNTLDFGLDIYEAVESPRIHHQLMPNIAFVQEGFDPSKIKALQPFGHEFFMIGRNTTVSAVQAVRRLPNGTAQGASDPRKYGLAAAY